MSTYYLPFLKTWHIKWDNSKEYIMFVMGQAIICNLIRNFKKSQNWMLVINKKLVWFKIKKYKLIQSNFLG